MTAFLTPKQLAEKLSLHERTVRDMLRRGEIPSYKLGGARRIDPEDLETFLAKRRQGE